MIERTETMPIGSSLPWLDVLEQLPFNDEGLLPAIAQQYKSGEVLMLAWMDRTAILETLSTGHLISKILQLGSKIPEFKARFEPLNSQSKLRTPVYHLPAEESF